MPTLICNKNDINLHPKGMFAPATGQLGAQGGVLLAAHQRAASNWVPGI
jgi:hypothetical protein